MAELTKVTLPKEVAEGIKYYRDKGASNYNILHLAEGAIISEPDLTLKKWAFEGTGSPDLLMKALVNGYEVERTPHDELREYYKELLDEYRNNPTFTEGFQVYLGKLVTLKRTIDILGITVDGINGKPEKEADPCR